MKTNRDTLSKTNRALMISGYFLMVSFIILMLFNNLLNVKMLFASVSLATILFIFFNMDFSNKNPFFFFTGFGNSLNDELHAQKYDYEHLIKPNAFVQDK